MLFAGPIHAVPSAPAPPPKAFHLQGKVLTPDGRPATDAAVQFTIMDYQAGKPALSQTVKTGADGRFDIAFSPVKTPKQYSILYVHSPDGVAVVLPARINTIVLHPKTRVRVHLVDEHGRPVAHARICPQSFVSENEGEHVFAQWDSAIAPQWNAVTDAAGTAAFDDLPQGDIISLSIDDNRYVQPEWREAIDLTKTTPSDSVTVHLQHGGFFSGFVVEEKSRKPAAGVEIQALEVDGDAIGSATTDRHGRYSIAGLRPGVYHVEVLDEPKQPGQWAKWTAVAHASLVVCGGKQISGVNFALVRGALITGHVLDPTTGKPVEGASVTVTGPAHPPGSRRGNSVETGPNGEYQVRVPAGRQVVSVYHYQTGVSLLPQSLSVADGTVKTINWKMAAPKPMRFVRGTVVGIDGAPVAGAEVLLWDSRMGTPRQKTDERGTFSFGPFPLSDGVRLYAKSGALGTAAAITPPPDGSPITLRLTAGAFCAFQGQVLDQDGRPFPRAAVTLSRKINDEGDMEVAAATADDSGRYQFPPDYRDGEYSVRAKAPGYTGGEISDRAKPSDEVLTFPPVVLSKADSFAEGVVLDLQGKPVAGAAVRLDELRNAQAITDQNGRFHLEGAPRHHALVSVSAPGGRIASVQIATGRDDSEITVKSSAEEAKEGRRFQAQRTSDTTNHGDGSDARALLQAAQARAAAAGKSVLLVFHASWCGPCFHLHRCLEDPAIKQILGKYFVVQELDLWEQGAQARWENPGARDIYKHDGGLSSIPFLVILDASGKKIGDHFGMPTDAEGRETFLRLLKTAQPNITYTEATTLQSELKRRTAL